MTALFGVALAVLGVALARRLAAKPRPAALPSLVDRDAEVERVGLALARGLDLARGSRSHREQRVELVGELGGRTLELRVDATGFVVRTPISARLPAGIHLRRRPAPGPDEREFAVELGTVRGRVPPGLVPALVSSCDERVSSLSLGKGRLELGSRVDVREYAGRPERVVGLVKHALRCAERLEREFARVC